MTDIILKIADFQDHAQDDTWQRSAANQLTDYLHKEGKKAGQYREYRKEKQAHQPVAEHNSIFISGGRGAGKTVFLHQAEKIWLEYKAVGHKPPDLCFLPQLDPTLLVDHDEFAHVIVASLYNEVEVKLRRFQSTHSDANKSLFYKGLKEISEALYGVR